MVPSWGRLLGASICICRGVIWGPLGVFEGTVGNLGSNGLCREVWLNEGEGAVGFVGTLLGLLCECGCYWGLCGCYWVTCMLALLGYVMGATVGV